MSHQICRPSTVLLAVSVLVAVSAPAQNPRHLEKGLRGTLEVSRVAEPNAEARAYTLSVMEPLFRKYVGKSVEDDPAALSDRVRKAYALIKAEKISLQFSDVSLATTEAALFTSGFDALHNRPRITAHSLLIRQREQSERPDSFMDVLAVSIAHEVIHFEVCAHALGYEHTDFEIQTEEAIIWGITIIEIVRPLAEQRRIPYRNMLRASTALAALSDDYTSPYWVRGFSEMVVAAPIR